MLVALLPLLFQATASFIDAQSFATTGTSTSIFKLPKELIYTYASVEDGLQWLFLENEILYTSSPKQGFILFGTLHLHVAITYII